MISALELARRLAQPQPTAQQQAVIEAPLSPALVTAGAGSGKTSTMANRVVWLIANELIRPDQVLGLTFTRKAAGSLSDRIAKGILALRGSSSLNAEAAVEFDQPTVSTYNSFASALFRDNALLIGREPESALLNEAAAWQLARRVVVASTDDRLVALEQSVDNLAEWVLNLAHAISDNDADPSEVAGFGERFAAIAELPYTAGKPKPAPYVSVTTAVAQVAALAPLTELAIAFQREKKRLGLLEFSDQVALALEVVSRSEAVRAEYRDRYRVVLLDEYQDTSVVQTRLLSALFADTAVMAVGDPHQSIYGWRGASAANLARFAADFTEASTATTFSLSVSWRNATTILDAANVLVAPLTALGAPTVGSPLAVAALEARPAAPVGAVTGWYFEEVTEEADGVAKWFKTQLAQRETENDADSLANSTPKSAAITYTKGRDQAHAPSADPGRTLRMPSYNERDECMYSATRNPRVECWTCLLLGHSIDKLVPLIARRVHHLKWPRHFDEDQTVRTLDHHAAKGVVWAINRPPRAGHAVLIRADDIDRVDLEARDLAVLRARLRRAELRLPPLDIAHGVPALASAKVRERDERHLLVVALDMELAGSHVARGRLLFPPFRHDPLQASELERRARRANFIGHPCELCLLVLHLISDVLGHLGRATEERLGLLGETVDARRPRGTAAEIIDRLRAG